MGARPCFAKLAHVLSRRPLYRIRIDGRVGLVFRHASTLSAGRACHADSSITSNAHTYADTTSDVDPIAHAHAASDLYPIAYTFPDHHAHSNRDVVALLYTTHR